MPLELRLKITDVKTGHVDLDIPSKSFVIAFIQLLAGNLKGGGFGGYTFAEQIVDIVGVAAQFGVPMGGAALFMNLNASSASYDITGIQVGSNSTAEAPTDRALNTKIDNGDGVGELWYSVMEFVVPVNVAGTISTIIARTVENRSPGAMTIREVGVYCQTQFGAANYTFCIIRDVIPDLPVAVGAIKLIEYIIQTVN